MDEGFLGYMDLRRNYFKTGQDAPVKDFLGIKIGSEICFDSVQGELFHFIKENKVILDMQLILADGAKGATPVEQEGVLFIKVEKNKEETQIGILKIDSLDNEKIELNPALSSDFLDGDDLTCFKFK